MNQIQAIEPEVIETKIIAEETPDQLEHKAYAQSLRMLADWVEENYQIPTPSKSIPLGVLGGAEAFSKIAKGMKTFTKEYGNNLIYRRKKFGVIEIEAIEYRHLVCERKVVGTKGIKKQKAIKFEEVEEQEEIVEWVCKDGSLLSNESNKEIGIV